MPKVVLRREFFGPVDTSKKHNRQSRLRLSPEVMGEKISTAQKAKMASEGWQRDSAIIH
ncbi:protein of unknown function [Agrobacterium pusense]|uniref:Uncharacterized protein n=1 Tax=Agrobacterium pusense TaxID=648995 RepID=U4PVL8_9HYPH|nr:protein of unknown function [Agrobacterium pusense]